MHRADVTSDYVGGGAALQRLRIRGARLSLTFERVPLTPVGPDRCETDLFSAPCTMGLKSAWSAPDLTMSHRAMLHLDAEESASTDIRRSGDQGDSTHALAALVIT